MHGPTQNLSRGNFAGARIMIWTGDVGRVGGGLRVDISGGDIVVKLRPSKRSFVGMLRNVGNASWRRQRARVLQMLAWLSATGSEIRCHIVGRGQFLARILCRARSYWMLHTRRPFGDVRKLLETVQDTMREILLGGVGATVNTVNGFVIRSVLCGGLTPGTTHCGRLCL